ncbi:uncharacterized protein LOC112568681 [Pomacea canaliculata]|nr:uncharacterized protein LOC112568681 [Pomacea canaliculata]
MNNPKPSPLLFWDDSHDHREVGPIFLSKDKVNRDQNGESHSCHANWSNETVSKSFTLNVAYGPDPDQVSVEKIQLSNISVVEVIDLRCTAQEVYPGVTFTWNVPCLNTTRNKESSDCTYHLAPEDNGKTVECTATNNFTNTSQHASYILTYTVVVTQETTHSLSITTALPETTETTEKQNDGVPILYIAVGAGCGFVVIVLCVTVICCMRRRNQGKDGVRFKGGVIRQSIKPTAVAARILQDPEGDKAAIVVDDFEDDVPSNDPVAKQAQSVIYDILNKRKKEVQFAEKSSSNLAYAQNQRNEPEKQTTGPTVSAVSATVFRTDSEEEAVTRL